MKLSHYKRALLAVKEMRATFTETGLTTGEGTKDEPIYRSKTHCAVIAIVGMNSIHHVENTNCHAGLSDGEDGTPLKGDRVAVIHSIQKEIDDLTIEEKTRYLDWLLNRSPYKDVFVNKVASAVLESGVIICETMIPANLMAGGMIAARRLSEYTGSVRIWCDLVWHGVNEDLAFLVAHTTTTGRDRTRLTRDCLAGHCSIDGWRVSDLVINNFVNGVLVNPREDYIKDISYRGVHNLWGDTDKADGEVYLHSFVHHILDTVPKKETKVSGNPFMCRNAKDFAAPYRDSIEFLAASLKEKYHV